MAAVPSLDLTPLDQTLPTIEVRLVHHRDSTRLSLLDSCRGHKNREQLGLDAIGHREVIARLDLTEMWYKMVLEGAQTCHHLIEAVVEQFLAIGTDYQQLMAN